MTDPTAGSDSTAGSGPSESSPGAQPGGAESAPASGGVPAGRAFRLEPTPPGLWRVVLGLAVGALAPLFGFLVGGALGSPHEGANDLMFVTLAIGIIIGGVGVLVAISGGVRLWRYFQDQQRAADEAEQTEALRAGG